MPRSRVPAAWLLAFVMTPLWCQTLAGRTVPVDALGLSLSTLQIVVVPVLIGAGRAEHGAS